jgi:hypothetical protein
MDSGRMPGENGGIWTKYANELGGILKRNLGAEVGREIFGRNFGAQFETELSNNILGGILGRGSG